MHIVLIYSDYKKLLETSVLVNEHDAEQMENTLKTVSNGLKNLGHKVTHVEATTTMLSEIEQLEEVDVLFSLTTGVGEKRYQANIIGMLEVLNIPIVGSGLSTHVFALNKEVTKIMLRDAGIRTAKSQLFVNGTEKIRDDFTFPVLVKPEHEGASVGIDDDSYVKDHGMLRDIIISKIEKYNGYILAEEFLPGREFTVGVWGNEELEALPVKEYVYKTNSDINMLTAEVKGEDLVDYTCPADIDEELERELKEMAIASYNTLRCRGFARIDMRLDSSGRPNVLELNTLPGLQIGYSDFPIAAKAAGYSYEEMLEKLIELAVE